MVDLYACRIAKGKMTIDDVPKLIKDDVRAVLLEDYGIKV